ncbi:MAG: DUF935 domain-containing protein [Corallincola sp.]|nr:DUF935 domain-containing protein [Corallincola sp.]
MANPFAKLRDLGGRVVKALSSETQSQGDDLANTRREDESHPSVGMTPASLAQCLRGAEQGDLAAQCDLAADLEEKSAHLFSELQKRKRALLTVPRRLAPPRNPSAAEQRDTDMLNELLADAPWFDDTVLTLADGILKGFSGCELPWRFEDKLWLTTPVEAPQRWFKTHPDRPDELRLRDGSHEGAELRPFGWIMHRHKSKSGYVARTGLIRVVCWPVLFSSLSVRDLAEFLEVYGLPIRIGKYPSGASQAEKASLMRAVMELGHRAGGIMSQAMQLEIQQAASGSHDPFMAMVEWAERSISKSVLGGTLTSQADGKSSTNALGNIHNEVRQELRDGDLKQIADTLNRDLVYPLWALNAKSFTSPQRLPRLVFDTQAPEDLATYSQALPPLVQMGMRIPVEWAHDKLQIPLADDKTPVLGMQQPPADKPGEAGLTYQLAALTAQQQTLAKFPDQQAIEDALDALSAGELNEDMRQLLAPLFAKAAQGPEALQQVLADLWPQLDDSAVQERLARVMFVGELWGEINGQG